MSELAIEILGWLGALLLVGAYGAITVGVCTSRGRGYQSANLVGALFVLVNAAWHGAWPPVILEVFWMAIALWGLIRPAETAPAGAAK